MAAAPHSARYLRLPVGACAVRRAPVKGQPPGGLLCGHRPRLRLNGYKTRILYNFAVRSAAHTKITRRRAPKSAFCTISLTRSRPPGKPAGGFRPLFLGACVCLRRFGCAVHAGFVFASAPALRSSRRCILSRARRHPPGNHRPRRARFFPLITGKGLTNRLRCAIITLLRRRDCLSLVSNGDRARVRYRRRTTFGGCLRLSIVSRKDPLCQGGFFRASGSGAARRIEEGSTHFPPRPLRPFMGAGGALLRRQLRSTRGLAAFLRRGCPLRGQALPRRLPRRGSVLPCSFRRVTSSARQ